MKKTTTYGTMDTNAIDFSISIGLIEAWIPEFTEAYGYIGADQKELLNETNVLKEEARALIENLKIVEQLDTLGKLTTKEATELDDKCTSFFQHAKLTLGTMNRVSDIQVEEDTSSGPHNTFYEKVLSIKSMLVNKFHEIKKGFKENANTIKLVDDKPETDLTESPEIIQANVSLPSTEVTAELSPLSLEDGAADTKVTTLGNNSIKGASIEFEIGAYATDRLDYKIGADQTLINELSPLSLEDGSADIISSPTQDPDLEVAGETVDHS